MNVFFSAGEASGDAYAAAMVTELKRINGTSSPLTFLGIGGKRFRDAGGATVADSSQWGAVSIIESLKVYPRVVRGYYRAKRFLKKSGPGLFIPIDFGFVNTKLARHAKYSGWTVLYFAPPGSWRRDKQGRDLPQITDAVATQFSWSEELLKKSGANAFWFGHPIRQLLRDRGVGYAPAASNEIAVLPGSRTHEIKQNLPILAKALTEPVEFALAPSVNLDQFKADWANLAPNRSGDRFTQGDVYSVLTRCKAAVVCSGTATLEAAMCRCPMVVIYKLSKVSEVEAKLIGFKIPEFVSLPNILLQRRAVPELIQTNATPENIRRELDSLLTDPEVRAAQITAFEELDSMLGAEDAITKTAELALKMIGSLPQVKA